MTKSDFTRWAVGLACLITFLLSCRAFQTVFGSGRLDVIAGLAVAGLGFLGLTRAGDGMAEVLLIPYAALALTLPLVPLLLWVTRFARSRSRPRIPQGAAAPNPESTGNQSLPGARGGHGPQGAYPRPLTPAPGTGRHNVRRAPPPRTHDSDGFSG